MARGSWFLNLALLVCGAVHFCAANWCVLFLRCSGLGPTSLCLTQRQESHWQIFFSFGKTAALPCCCCPLPILSCYFGHVKCSPARCGSLRNLVKINRWSYRVEVWGSVWGKAAESSQQTLCHTDQSCPCLSEGGVLGGTEGCCLRCSWVPKLPVQATQQGKGKCFGSDFRAVRGGSHRFLLLSHP